MVGVESHGEGVPDKHAGADLMDGLQGHLDAVDVDMLQVVEARDVEVGSRPFVEDATGLEGEGVALGAVEEVVLREGVGAEGHHAAVVADGEAVEGRLEDGVEVFSPSGVSFAASEGDVEGGGDMLAAEGLLAQLGSHVGEAAHGGQTVAVLEGGFSNGGDGGRDVEGLEGADATEGVLIEGGDGRGDDRAREAADEGAGGALDDGVETVRHAAPVELIAAVDGVLAVDHNARGAEVAPEGILGDVVDGGGDADGTEVAAVVEGVGVDGLQPLVEGHILEVGAVVEGAIAEGGEGGGKTETAKGEGLGESIGADSGDSLGDGEAVGGAPVAGEGGLGGVGIDEGTLHVAAQGLGTPGAAGGAAAVHHVVDIVESIGTDGVDGAGHLEGLQMDAVHESIAADGGDGGGEGDMRGGGEAGGEGGLAVVGIDQRPLDIAVEGAGTPAVGVQRAVVDDVLHVAEGIETHRLDAVGHHHRGEAGAVLEGHIPDVPKGGGKRSKDERHTAHKGHIIDFGDALRDDHRGEVEAVGESVAANGGDGVGGAVPADAGGDDEFSLGLGDIGPGVVERRHHDGVAADGVVIERVVRRRYRRKDLSESALSHHEGRCKNK